MHQPSGRLNNEVKTKYSLISRDRFIISLTTNKSATMAFYLLAVRQTSAEHKEELMNYLKISHSFHYKTLDAITVIARLDNSTADKTSNRPNTSLSEPTVNKTSCLY